MAGDVFLDQPVLIGEHVRLDPLTAAVLGPYLAGLDDPEVRHLTGSQARFEPNAVERWLATRRRHLDRADWAVMRSSDGAFLGEAVLNELDARNECVNYRVWLAGAEATGRGYGTEVTSLVISYALNDVGLHRLALGVYAFNLRAFRVYENCRFLVGGQRRDALRWNGSWYAEIMMSVLSTDPRPGNCG